MQALFSGITTNPPIEVQEQFHWGILGDVEIKRGTEVAKEKVVAQKKESTPEVKTEKKDSDNKE